MVRLDSTIENTLRHKSDYELYKISISKEDEYTLQAIEFSKDLLRKRNVSDEKVRSFENKIANEIGQENIKSNVEAKFYEKIACFLFPGILLFLVFADLKAKGYSKKALQLRLASNLGIAFYFVLIMLILIWQILSLLYLQHGPYAY